MREFIRVLIVDDENIFRNRLRHLLAWEEEGFLLVGFAENGRQALSLLDATMPQIVITDIAMPVMDGIELLKEIGKRNGLPQNREHPIGSIVISGFETFSYVRDAMKAGTFDYILKSELTQENLLQRLRNLSASLPQKAGRLNLGQFCTNLLRGTYTSLPFIQEHIASCGLSMDVSAPMFLIQSFCADPSEVPIQALDAHRSLQQTLSGTPVAMLMHHDTCVLFGERPQLCHVIETIRRCSGDFPALYWGVFPEVKNILDLPRGMGGLEQIPAQYFYAPNRQVFFFSDSVHFTHPQEIPPAPLEKAAAQSDYLQVSSLFGDFLSLCAQEKASPYAVRKNCEHAVYLLILSLERVQYQTVSLSRKKIDYFQRIESAGSIDELCDILEDILSDLTSLNDQRMEGNVQLLGEIDRFIADNYMRPLHLSDLAKQVHLSYHYLSRILKGAHGESFNDYLNRVRIDAACCLLTTTDRDLSRIAEEVGFTDQSYFGKVFKKITGLPPRLYRMKNGAWAE